jgi:tryptophan synthase beta chain
VLKSTGGFFGNFGGAYVPEILHHAIEELTIAYSEARADSGFWKQYKDLLSTYSCRPTPLTYAVNLTHHFGGPRIYLKREDLNHTGAHKLNNVMGQGLLALRMGKKRVIAETGAGQHGIATATMAAKLGLESTIYMGAIDVQRQYPNVFWMRNLGAEVEAVNFGSRTLKDAINEAMRDWAGTSRETHYVLGTACGPHPFPEMVMWLQSVIGDELRDQVTALDAGLPRALYACVGGGSNALGLFSAFLEDPNVRLVGAEAGGDGVASGRHAVRLAFGERRVGVAQGYKTVFLQNHDGQMSDTHSVAAGLDYIGVSPIVALLAEQQRIECVAVSDDEAIGAARLCMKHEGIIPALESSHALAAAFREVSRFDTDDYIVINISGRGDKDIFNFATAFHDRKWFEYLRAYLEASTIPHQDNNVPDIP